MITFLQAAEVAATEEARMGLWELFTKGGWLMWPLLILGGDFWRSARPRRWT